ncbi:MAG: nicotinate-nucleotide--dimethylbenzimidazole phosphoribosyltransferase [Lachnospiraceae bacterium]|nr:nicotinate-nucleotide--dimethylbenzimidazole phosphoribosyltransferase [Lachnospiraceae bacterium]
MEKNELFSLEIKQPDEGIKKASKERWDNIAKPLDGLGEFEEMISRIAAIQGKVIPDTSRRALVIMCADNGVVKEGVSQTDSGVTADVALLMGKRKSSVGIMTKDQQMDIFVYDMGIDSDDTPKGVINKKIRKGTTDFLKDKAFETTECLEAIETGIDAVKNCRDKGYTIIATGEMGIGNTTTGAALLCAICGLDPEHYTGKGAGLTDSAFRRKMRVIKEGLKLHRKEKIFQPVDSKEEMLEVLSSLGGLDIAALAGVFIGGAMYGMPVIIDGFISAVAALIAEKLVRGCREYMIASHLGREKGMAVIMEELSLNPVIHADMALGEGTGAVMLFPLMDMVTALYKEGTRFEEAHIEQYERYDK